MAFKAIYSGGICRNCGNRVQRGQFITWTRRVKGSVRHLNCENPWSWAGTQPGPPKVELSAEVIEKEVDKVIEETKDTAAVDTLAQALIPHLEKLVSDRMAKAVDKIQVQEQINKAQAAERQELEKLITGLFSDLSSPTLKIETYSGQDVHKTEIPFAHENMAKLLYLVSKRHHVYLYGGPGSGKSTAARLTAEALGWKYGYISVNPQTPESRLIGFMDANGNYRETVFYQRYKDGGVFCIDEVDNTSPSFLTTLNSGLENGWFAFPCGMVEKHQDFVVITTGNTCGRGANPMFPDRRPFDAAFSERFTFLAWNYDKKLERSIALAINPKASSWIDWVQKLRAYCTASYPRVLVSPRASFKGATYLLDKDLTIDDIAESLIFKGLDDQTKNTILGSNPLPRAS